ncbi:Bacterial membrane flanked domain protein [Nostocoides japonicum T1-X7]|uniref:Bacterial membrane flanked domain protein n=1 Tax=Nostocoides japonicum T1-X7 TaxID=1194083 RepID=A0A077LUL4_9MICO|nr:PH domain-containing protein [Tetrasphaera japonica]CCH77226.1 Bacterial membrane flanked domain protein [Tetrasphaera japonica T1-X7]
MGLSRKLLGEDERVVLHMRTHPKQLVGPVLALVVILALMVAALVFLQGQEAVISWVVVAVALLAVVVVVPVRILRWATTTYTVTDRRIITRRGLVNRVGHDLPLVRINDVSYDRSLLDRVLGCGTLRLTTAADDPVILHDVPDVERVHVVITELLFGATGPGYEPRSARDDDA